MLAGLTSSCGALTGSGADSTACASSPLVGQWTKSGETITFNGACAFTSSICNARATFTAPSTSTGQTIFRSWSVSAGCMTQPTERTCDYTITGTSVALTCTPSGGGTCTRQ